MKDGLLCGTILAHNLTAFIDAFIDASHENNLLLRSN